MYKSGTWKSVCAVCGFEFTADKLIQRWDGVYTCKEDWEPRHVLDFFTSPPPEATIPWTQKVDEDYRITPTTSQGFGVTNLAASLTETIFTITPGAIIEARLPSANDATFLNCSRVYIIYNTGTSSSLLVGVTTGSLQGSTSILAGACGIFRSVPSQNIWIREN